MRSLLLSLLACLTCVFAADAVAEFKEAMGGQDQAAKKKAIQGLLALPKEQDDTVLSLLASAVEDRQAGKSAISALRSRTGLAPAAKRGAGGYPAYPPEDTPAAWNAWIAARKAELDAKKAQKEIKKELEKLEDKVEGDKPAEGTPTDEATTVAAPKTPTAPDDLGGLDRIHFQNSSATSSPNAPTPTASWSPSASRTATVPARSPSPPT